MRSAAAARTSARLCNDQRMSVSIMAFSMGVPVGRNNVRGSCEPDGVGALRYDAFVRVQTGKHLDPSAVTNPKPQFTALEGFAGRRDECNEEATFLDKCGVRNGDSIACFCGFDVKANRL